MADLTVPIGSQRVEGAGCRENAKGNAVAGIRSGALRSISYSHSRWNIHFG